MSGDRISCITPKPVVVHFPCSNLLMCDLQISRITDFNWRYERKSSVVGELQFFVGLHFGHLVSMCVFYLVKS